MKNKFFGLIVIMLSLFLLASCSASGEKSEGISYIYGITTIVSLFFVLYYCLTTRIKKNIWYYVLFVSVSVVNVGYLILSRSQSLNMALNANRIAYLGSTFLPMSMFMITLRAIKVNYKKHLPIILTSIAFLMFIIAASPGYMNIYYKEVSLEIVNGVSTLKKVYGDYHFLYMLYLLGYFTAMITCIVYAYRKKRIDSTTNAVIITTAVFINLAVWLIEQFIKINVEFLAISYIISELFLLCLQFVISENERLKELVKSQTNTTILEEPKVPTASCSAFDISEDKIKQYLSGVKELTATERIIYKYYTSGKSTKEIMSELNIKENTLKFHNKNIYSKLGVSSRKQLIEIYKQKSDIINVNGDTH